MRRRLDGASAWQMFRHITPAAGLAVHHGRHGDPADRRAEDVRHIYVITLGGPGTSSETINILLYQTAFAYYDLGYGSAIVVVFFLLILLISLLLLRVRQREAWR